MKSAEEPMASFFTDVKGRRALKKGDRFSVSSGKEFRHAGQRVLCAMRAGR